MRLDLHLSFQQNPSTLHRVASLQQSCHHRVEQLRHLIVVLVDFQNLHVFLFYSFVRVLYLFLCHLYQTLQLRHRVVVDDRHLCHQMVRRQEMLMVNDKEMKNHQDVMNLVHQLLAVDYFVPDVLQNLGEQNQDVHLTLVDVVRVVIFQVFFRLHQDELVLPVDVVRRRQN